MSTVPVFAPDGTLGDIPADKLKDALKAGGKMGVDLIAPNGTRGTVPIDRMHEAIKAGAMPIGSQPGVTLPTPESSMLGYLAPGAGAERLQKYASNVPGSFEGNPQNVGEYVPASVGEFAGGLNDVRKGDVSRGVHRMISGTGNALMPVASLVGLPIAAAAPATTAASIGGSLIGQTVAEKAATAVGASPDQTALAGDIGSLAGGYGGGRLLQSLKPSGSELVKAARGMYQSAMKPSTTLSPQEVSSVLNTGLTNEIPVSGAGSQRLQALIEDLNDKTKAVLASDPEKTISPKAVAGRMNQVRPTFENQVNPESDLAALSASKQEFINKHTNNAPYTKIEFRPVDGGDVGAVPTGNGIQKTIQDIPVLDAQLEKQGTYKMLRGKYGELGSAQIEAQKALARGIKEELITQFPELKALGQKEAAMIDLQEQLERAVNRINNREPIGIGTPLVAAGTKAITGSTGMSSATALLDGLLRNPMVKSRLAIALYKAGVNPGQANLRILGLSNSLGRAVSGSNNAPDANQ